MNVVYTRLFSLLVTRHTGRTIRGEIEQQISRAGGPVLAVLDMGGVPLIDYSCADEIVAKLASLAAASPEEDESEGRRFVLFRGVCDRHLEPIECVLCGQALAAAAETADGEPVLLGSLGERAVSMWREVWRLGEVSDALLAQRLGLPAGRVRELLDELVARALVIRADNRYVSLGQAFRDAEDGLAAEARR